MKCPICKGEVIWLNHIICNHCCLAWETFPAFILDKVRYLWFVRWLWVSREELNRYKRC